jgi:hypothetical protein
MKRILSIAAAVGLGVGLGLSGAGQQALADRPSPRRGQAQKPVAQAAQPEKPKSLRIGDIEIRNARQMKGALDLSTSTITGPNTMIEVPDKASGSHLSLHADEIVVTGINQPGHGHIVMSGHLRYTLTQPTPEGVRRLAGTAVHGDFRRETQRIALTGGVRCDLTDPRLEGPGMLRASTVDVDIKSEPYLFTLSGDSGANDLRFTPRARAGRKSPTTQVGEIHITRWDSGTFKTGEIAKFDGAAVVADLKSRSGSQEGRLTARHIQGDFAPTGEVVSALAQDDVHFDIHRPIARKRPGGKDEEGRQEVSGTSRQALLESEAGRFTLDGDIDATVVNTLNLAEPARIQAARLVVTEPPAGSSAQPMRFELTGAPNHRRLTFTPRPPEPAPATPVPAAAPAATAAPFSLGSVVLTGFQTGVLEPGKTIDVVSDGTQMLLLDTSDPKTHSASHLETRHFTAALAESGAITSAQTEGPVTFHIQQATRQRPARAAGAVSPAPRPSVTVLHTLDGKAARAVYTTEGQGRSIALKGPFTATVIDPERLAGPGSVKGQKDDTFALDLVTREYTFDTPNQTMVFEFTPRPLDTEATPTAGPPAGKKK